jgi:lipid-binding SYLF domain-containing protein
MRKTIALILVVAMAAFPLKGAGDEKETARLAHCGKAFDEIMNMPDSVPRFVMDRADCVIVLPAVKKGSAFIFSGGFGGTFGRGAMTCRTGEHFDGKWGAPTMVALEGMSWGIEMGGESIDVLILVMNPDGAKSILTSKAKIGGNASASAGPVGRNVAAESDAMMHSELLTYSRAKGLFAGAALTGSTLRADGPANRKIYGKNVDAIDVVLHSAEPATDEAKPLLDALMKWSPKNLSDPNKR